MAEKKNNATHAQDQRLREDIASFKSSVAFLLFCAVIFFTATNLQYTRTSLQVPIRSFVSSYPIVMAIPVLLAALSIFWRLRSIKRKKDEGFSYFSSSDAVIIASFIIVFCLTFAMTYSTAVLITVTVGFALCYYSTRFFSRDFMLTTFMNAAMAMLLWLIGGTSSITGAAATFAKILFLVLSILTVLSVLAVIVCSYTGKLGISIKGSFVPTVISLVIGIALCGMLIFAPAVVSFLIAEIILLVQYVALGVYYTVRLLNQ